VLPQEDLQVLVAVGAPRRGDQVDEEGHDMSEQEPELEDSSTLLTIRRLPGQPPRWRSKPVAEDESVGGCGGGGVQTHNRVVSTKFCSFLHGKQPIKKAAASFPFVVR
jgi:hypothetical protein